MANKSNQPKKKMPDKTVKSGKKMTDKIIKYDQGIILPPMCQVTKTSLKIDKSISGKEYLKVGDFLKRLDGAIQFWVGDWYLRAYADARFFGGTAYSASLIFPKRYVQNIAYVCKRIESSRRREDVSFSHHQVVAPLKPKEQDFWLEKAAKEDISVMKLRRDIKRAKIEKEKKEYGQKDFIFGLIDKKHYFYTTYFSMCYKALVKSESMVRDICSWRDEYSIELRSDKNAKLLLEKADELLRFLNVLLNESIKDDKNKK